jgi:hypothetical protein
MSSSLESEMDIVLPLQMDLEEFEACDLKEAELEACDRKEMDEESEDCEVDEELEMNEIDEGDKKGESFLELFAKGLQINNAENERVPDQYDDTDSEDESDGKGEAEGVDEKSYATTDDEAEENEEDDEEPLYDAENKSVPLHTTFFSLAMGDMLKHHDHYVHELDEADRIPSMGEEYFAAGEGRKRFKGARKTGESSAWDSASGSSVSECEGDKRVRKLRELFKKGFKTRVKPGDHPNVKSH